MVHNPFSFSGRIRRSEFVFSQLFVLFLFYVLMAAVAHRIISIQMFFLFIIPLIWIFSAQNTKRCHDRGNSGSFQFVPFYYLILLFGDSDYGFNEYGPNPKDLGNNDKYHLIGKAALELRELEKCTKLVILLKMSLKTLEVN